MYLYVKYKLLIKEREKKRFKNFKNPTVFTDYSQTIDGFYKSFENYNPTKKRGELILFLDMIVDMQFNKKLSLIVVTELFLKERKLNLPSM